VSVDLILPFLKPPEYLIVDPDVSEILRRRDERLTKPITTEGLVVAEIEPPTLDTSGPAASGRCLARLCLTAIPLQLLRSMDRLSMTA